jgi:hypothetical protein
MAKITSSPIGQTIDTAASTISRSVVSGGGRGSVPTGGGGSGGNSNSGGGGGIVVRPQVSLVDGNQDLRIQRNEETISSLGQSLGVIQTQIVDLGNNINQLATQLQTESSLEQTQLRQEQENRRRLLERKIREGKESQLEQNITSALARPIVRLQKNITSLFDRIMGALTTLFFGWLTNEGIETLKALAAGDKKKLEEIKGNVIKNILYAVGAFAAVKLGFNLLMRTITGLSLRIVGLTARIALAPFQVLGRQLGIGGREAQVAAGAANAARGEAKVAAVGGNIISRMFNAIKGVGIKGAGGAAEGAAAKTGSRLIPGLQQGLAALSTGIDLSQGDYLGAALSASSGLPGPLGWLGLGARTLYGYGKGEFNGLMGSNTSEDQSSGTPSQPSSAESNSQPTLSTPTTPTITPTPTQTPTPTPTETPTISPQTTMMPSAPSADMVKKFEMAWQYRNNPMARGKIEDAWEKMTDEQKLQAKEWAKSKGYDWNEMKLKEPANIQSPPKQETPVGTLPEPQPNIIMAGGGTDRTQVSAPQQEPLTDVPFIPSANPDNFYSLYSQVSYNVVM